jgi:hypothetical protein
MRQAGQVFMAMYVYSTEGEPVGFVYDTFIHDFGGAPLGRIVGCRVHRLDGSYVGEWFKEMVVDRPTGRARAIPPIEAPPHRASPGTGTARRAVVDYGYADSFSLLYERAPVSQAAE